jgi:hypothetical protein
MPDDGLLKGGNPWRVSVGFHVAPGAAMPRFPPPLRGLPSREIQLAVSGFLLADDYLGHLGWGDDSGDDVKSVQAEKLE